MDPKYIILICAGAVLVIALIIVAVLLRRHRRKGEGERAEEVKIIDGVRYTKNDVIATPAGQANITLRPGDFLLEQGKSVTAEQGGRFLPGKYTVLATGEQTQSFKLRLGGYVREYEHGDTVVVGNGETVSAVSCSVIFR